MNTAIKPEANKSLLLATVAFAIAFANWGLIAGLAPLWRKELGVSLTQASVAIAIPVLLGSLGRIPMGILTDRFGGRLMFSILLSFGILPSIALAVNHSYLSLLFWGFWLGVAGTSFAIGVAFVSRWFPPEKQGTALGIYGAGNIGQSVAVFFGPVLAKSIGIPATFVLFGAVSLAWGAVFAFWARNAETKAKPRTFQENMRVLRTEKLSWVLSLFYALTFGGFVALSIYLPTLLKEMFELTPEDAGARTALFVVLATGCRPVGGWLANRIGGQQLLVYVFGGLFCAGWLMAVPSMIPFTAGVLGYAVLLGLGNGGVFKLVPQYFPQQTGKVTGLVGAAGGLGGFFPPIELGILKDVTGSYALGFVFFSLFALTCGLVLSRTFLHTPAPSHHRHIH
ncbi:MAG: MFS transporter [Oscillatoria sp. Prado101]|jgi:NNP family nitrate/nitrite transporter-like MFS transporter|nr:MFS transporter [Oscillatoria sp. Prado101]